MYERTSTVESKFLKKPLQRFCHDSCDSRSWHALDGDSAVKAYPEFQGSRDIGQAVSR
jgi:hypothetical protein